MSEASAEAEFDGDLSEVDEVWLGDQAMAGHDFVEALLAVKAMARHMEEFREELDDLQVGLDREDAVNLIWGRTSLNKTQIETTFEVMDAIIEEDPEDIAPRLLADQTSELTIAEAAEVWDDMMDLAEKYGETPDNDE